MGAKTSHMIASFSCGLLFPLSLALALLDQALDAPLEEGVSKDDRCEQGNSNNHGGGDASLCVSVGSLWSLSRLLLSMICWAIVSWNGTR
jgi:hypothetical protein